MNRLDRFCEAIQAFEGWAPGSRSFRNCNPGNLRRSVVQSGTEGGYATFDRYSQGWAALVSDVTSKCQGRTVTGLTGNSTILEFFHVYAPGADNNHPATYAAFVAKRAGLQITDTLASLLEG